METGKFKVGDRVNSEGSGTNSLGTVVSLDRNGDSHKVKVRWDDDGSEGWWKENSLILITATPQFKVGDSVRQKNGRIVAEFKPWERGK